MQIGQCVECGGQAKPGMNKCPEHLVGIGLTPDRHNPKRTVIIWVIVVSCVAYIGYHGWLRPNAEPVTLEEYAVVICGANVLHDGATWGEAREYARVKLSEHNGLAPPGDLVPYHEGRIETLEGFLDAIRDKDANAIMNEYELIFDPDAMRAARALGAGERSLSIENRRLLRQHGCRF